MEACVCVRFFLWLSHVLICPHHRDSCLWSKYVAFENLKNICAMSVLSGVFAISINSVRFTIQAPVSFNLWHSCAIIHCVKEKAILEWPCSSVLQLREAVSSWLSDWHWVRFVFQKRKTAWQTIIDMRNAGSQNTSRNASLSCHWQIHGFCCGHGPPSVIVFGKGFFRQWKNNQFCLSTWHGGYWWRIASAGKSGKASCFLIATFPRWLSNNGWTGPVMAANGWAESEYSFLKAERWLMLNMPKELWTFTKTLLTMKGISWAG